MPCSRICSHSVRGKQEIYSKRGTLRITALVGAILALCCLGTSYILKGVSLLPYQYTQGLELVYGLSALCFQALAGFFAALAAVLEIASFLPKH